MNIVVSRNSIAFHGKISEFLAWLQAAPGKMLVQEYIRINLH